MKWTTNEPADGLVELLVLRSGPLPDAIGFDSNDVAHHFGLGFDSWHAVHLQDPIEDAMNNWRPVQIRRLDVPAGFATYSLWNNATVRNAERGR